MPVGRLERADQHRGADALGLADHVEQRVDPVGAVDVGACPAAPNSVARARRHADVGVAGRPRPGGRPRSRRSRRRSSPWRTSQPTRSRATSRTGRAKKSAVDVTRQRGAGGSSCSRTRASDVPPSETFDSSHDGLLEHGAAPPRRGRRLDAARAACPRPLVARRTRPATTPWASRNGVPALDEQVGEVGRGDQLVGGRGGHPLAVERRALDHAARGAAGTARACRPRRRGAPCPPACPCCRSAAARACTPWSADEVADDPRRLGAQQLGGVGVLLLRHDRRAARPRVGQRHEAELLGRPQHELLARGGERCVAQVAAALR